MNPLLQVTKPGALSFVSDTGRGANSALATVVFSTIITPSGNSQISATPCVQGRNIIVANPTGAGIIASPFDGCSQEILNLTSTAVVIYPPLGTQFYGQTLNAPGAVPANNTVSEVFTADGLTYYLLSYALTSLISYPTSDAGLPANSLWNNGGFLCITPITSTLYPTSSFGLTTGTLWNNGGFICIAP